MDHLATDGSPNGGGNIAPQGQPADGSVRVAALAEARGVVCDALASVRNLEHLLRSPRVGARAIAQLIPGLKGSCDPLAFSVDQILEQVRAVANAPVEGATTELEAFMPGVVDRLRAALDQRSGGAVDAKGRLAFENAIVLVGAELNSVRQLLDLLIRATERSDTDLSIQEVVHETFVASFRPGPPRNPITVLASYETDASDFRASPQILMPLISIAIAMVRGAAGEPISLQAICMQDEPVQIIVSRGGPRGTEEYTFEPPLIVAPTLVCAQTAARLAGGTFVADADRGALCWPR
ncbi:MAG TPA: hypothetical protein VK550_21290 [Polyangiaceae bacterium]|nr:hypothetical protein [Polyangiaceae bacterium]